MSGPPNKRRRTTAIGPGSPVFAKAFTHKTVTSKLRTGEVIEKDILVPLQPLIPPEDNATAPAIPIDITNQEYDGNMDGNLLNDINEDYSPRNKSNVKYTESESFV